MLIIALHKNKRPKDHLNVITKTYSKEPVRVCVTITKKINKKPLSKKNELLKLMRCCYLTITVWKLNLECIP